MASTPATYLSSITNMSTTSDQPQPPNNGVKTEQVKRPPNDYLIYSSDKHAELRELPEFRKMTLSEKSKHVSYLWQNEKEIVKKLYKARASAAKLKHAELNPGYKYKPRPPKTGKRKKATMGGRKAKKAKHHRAKREEEEEERKTRNDVQIASPITTLSVTVNKTSNALREEEGAKVTCIDAQSAPPITLPVTVNTTSNTPLASPSDASTCSSSRDIIDLFSPNNCFTFTFQLPSPTATNDQILNNEAPSTHADPDLDNIDLLGTFTLPSNNNDDNANLELNPFHDVRSFEPDQYQSFHLDEVPSGEIQVEVGKYLGPVIPGMGVFYTNKFVPFRYSEWEHVERGEY